MADYWKSQPRKFCQYCKCWIADNKPSIEFHERGKNHKENVAAKISEIKKKSIEKAKQEERMTKQFAAMEEAAMKAYEEDLKRMEREAAGISSPAQTASTVQPQPKPQPQPQVKSKPKKQKNKAEKASKKFTEQPETQVWVEGQTDDGQTYYYNTITGESQWENPQGLQGESSAQSGQTENFSGCPWMEAISPDGYTYYYNTETGESSWEKPENFHLNEASGSSPVKEEESQEEPLTPQSEPLSDEESPNRTQESQEAEVAEETSQQSKIPKISFRKRKAEVEPSEKEGEDKANDETPKKEEEVQITAAVPEEKREEQRTPVQTQAKRLKTANPYGTWEQIQQEEDPYAKVDLQLPQVEGSSAKAPADVPPEPKPKFKERVITSLGDESGPASFKKNKTQNGKSRSLRQRDNDD
ncbi:WW domain-binding protein 4 [Echeneis naucrates]|uniref:WW domain-binding protein 4 n=1 Tax=Echeneis naucrates TaxID=173247 RepID=UPI0011144778|nr:WW domain-binding protein 4 [Echeneis naucrates]